mmetsp:Transcript_4169/g.10623  ORF Transcript_4169/g.10623 Transcript_4169/m.10623 type:complete len:266 (+) Transcript_4169:156-953(+)
MESSRAPRRSTPPSRARTPRTRTPSSGLPRAPSRAGSVRTRRRGCGRRPSSTPRTPTRAACSADCTRARASGTAQSRHSTRCCATVPRTTGATRTPWSPWQTSWWPLPHGKMRLRRCVRASRRSPTVHWSSTHACSLGSRRICSPRRAWGWCSRTRGTCRRPRRFSRLFWKRAEVPSSAPLRRTSRTSTCWKTARYWRSSCTRTACDTPPRWRTPPPPPRRVSWPSRCSWRTRSTGPTCSSSASAPSPGPCTRTRAARRSGTTWR